MGKIETQELSMERVRIVVIYWLTICGLGISALLQSKVEVRERSKRSLQEKLQITETNKEVNETRN